MRVAADVGCNETALRNYACAAGADIFKALFGQLAADAAVLEFVRHFGVRKGNIAIGRYEVIDERDIVVAEVEFVPPLLRIVFKRVICHGCNVYWVSEVA